MVYNFIMCHFLISFHISSFELRQIISFFHGIGEKFPMTNGSKEKSMASLIFNLKDNEVQ